MAQEQIVQVEHMHNHFNLPICFDVTHHSEPEIRKILSDNSFDHLSFPVDTTTIKPHLSFPTSQYDI